MCPPAQPVSDLCPKEPSSGNPSLCTANGKDAIHVPVPRDDQKDVLAFLGRPESHGADAPIDRLGLVDSILYFTPDHTYRIRKHRPMGSRDSVPLEQRAALCEAELAFGLSTSPEVYQCLRPILLGDEGLELGASVRHVAQFCLPTNRKLVDWVVQMRRYDYTQTFDKVGGLEDLPLASCDALARYLVDLHCWSSSYDQQDWLDWLCAHLASFDDRPQLFAPQPGLRGLRASLDQAQTLVEQLKPLLKTRSQHGQVQALHGNMRLANFVSLDCGPRLINPRFIDGEPQRGDCLFDLAGLLIDLWSQGMREQSNWIFSRYLGSLLDNSALDGLQALGLMMFVRSIDRALAICPSDKACISGARCSLAAAFEGFVRTAMESLLSERKVLVIVAGGDSQKRQDFACALAPSLGRMPGALWLSADHEASLLDPGDHDQYETNRPQNHLNDMVLSYMLEKARYGLEANFSVLLDWSSGSYPARLQAMLQFAEATDALLLPIWLSNAEETEVSTATMIDQGWSVLDSELDMDELQLKAHGLVTRLCERSLPTSLH